MISKSFKTHKPHYNCSTVLISLLHMLLTQRTSDIYIYFFKLLKCFKFIDIYLYGQLNKAPIEISKISLQPFFQIARYS